MEKELRRRTDDLAALGTGVCFYGLWGIIKTVMELLADPDALRTAAEAQYGAFAFAATVIILLFIMALALLPFFIVGLSARGEGLHGKNHIVYLFPAGALALMHLWSAFMGYRLFDEKDFLSVIVSIIMDVTVSITLIQVIVNSVKVKKLRKQLAEKEAENER